MTRSWLVCGTLLLAACGGSSPAADTGVSGPTLTGSSTTGTSAAPTSDGGTAADATTTTSPAAPGSWVPPCREALAPASAAAFAFDGTTQQFGPLASVPAIDVLLPELTAVLPDGRTAQVTAVARSVNGGALVGLGSGTDAEADSAVLALVRLDGTRRWERCLPGNAIDVWVAAPAEEPRTALVATYRNTTPFVANWQLVALDTGATTTGFTDAVRRAGVDPATLSSAGAVDVSSTAVLLSRTEAVPGTGTSVTGLLLRYDLVDESVTVIPPPSPDGYGNLGYELGPGDAVVATSFASGVVAVHTDGEWRRDETTRRAARPIEVRFNWGTDPSTAHSLEGVDALGTVVWRDSDLTDLVQEGGLQIVTDGAMTLANVCVERSPDSSCNRSELVGVDTASGAVRWRLAGGETVVLAADGWALATDGVLTTSSDGMSSAPGYLLLDDRTGAPVDGQRWKAGTFATGCCGEGQYLWVERAGGVVFTATDGHLRVWYPKSALAETATVSLP